MIGTRRALVEAFRECEHDSSRLQCGDLSSVEREGGRMSIQRIKGLGVVFCVYHFPPMNVEKGGVSHQFVPVVCRGSCRSSVPEDNGEVQDHGQTWETGRQRVRWSGTTARGAQARVAQRWLRPCLATTRGLSSIQSMAPRTKWRTT